MYRLSVTRRGALVSDKAMCADFSTALRAALRIVAEDVNEESELQTYRLSERCTVVELLNGRRTCVNIVQL